MLQAAALSRQLGVPVQSSGKAVGGKETVGEKQKRLGDQLAQIASLTVSVQKEVRERWETPGPLHACQGCAQSHASSDWWLAWSA
jgi:hypothetical protein